MCKFFITFPKVFKTSISAEEAIVNKHELIVCNIAICQRLIKKMFLNQEALYDLFCFFMLFFFFFGQFGFSSLHG